MSLSSRLGTFSATLVLAVLGCGPDRLPGPPDTSPSVTLAYVSGSGQIGVVGSGLAEPLVSRVLDDQGNGVAGVAVHWSAKTGGGTLSAESALTDASGYAEVVWTLGTTIPSGPAEVTASLSGSGSPIGFTATMLPGPAEKIERIAGGRSARIGSVQEIKARVTDAFDNPVSDVVVLWFASRGIVASPRDTSGGDGLVQTTWQVPLVPGVDLVQVLLVDAFDITADFEVITTSRLWTHEETLWSWSSPAIGADGTIYYGTRSGQLRAVNPDGSLRWKYVVGGSGETVEEGPSVAPDGRIYVGSFPGILFHAVTPQGARAWTFPVTNWVRSTPAIGADGSVYALGFGDSLYALTSDGSRRWAVAIPDASDDSPVIGTDGVLYVPEAMSGRLHAIGPDGVTRWVHTFSGPSINNDLGTPAIGQDGTIYLAAQDRKLHALDSNGNERWAVSIGSTSFAPGPAIAIGSDGTIYVGAAGTGIYAVTSQGAVRWNTSAFTPGFVFGAPIVRADGSVVYADSGGGLYCVSAEGTLLWVDRVMRGGGLGSPAISPDGTIYLTSGSDGLVAFEGGVPPAAAPWPMYMKNQYHSGRQD